MKGNVMKNNLIEFEKLNNELFKEDEMVKLSELKDIKGGQHCSLPMSIATVGGDEEYRDY